jgi:hypothetical protein
MKRTDLKIKHCFWRSEDGKCGSPEIYRFLKDMETGKPCPIDPELTAFFLDGSSYSGKLRCPEFRHIEGKVS